MLIAKITDAEFSPLHHRGLRHLITEDQIPGFCCPCFFFYTTPSPKFGNWWELDFREGKQVCREERGQDKTSPTFSCNGWLAVASPNPLPTLLCAQEDRPARITLKSTLALLLPAVFSCRSAHWQGGKGSYLTPQFPLGEGTGHICRAALSSSPWGSWPFSEGACNMTASLCY